MDDKTNVSLVCILCFVVISAVIDLLLNDEIERDFLSMLRIILMSQSLIDHHHLWPQLVLNELPLRLHNASSFHAQWAKPNL